MAGINRLTEATPTSASQVPFYDPAAGVDRRASLSAIGEALGVAAAAPLTTQYAAPNATAFDVQIDPPEDGASVFLLLTPAAGYADGGITLPALADCVDGQEVLCSCTQAVTTFAVDGNGATVNGAPATLAANGFFRLRFDGVFSAWYRVG
jgi:hypothetical protein